MFPWAYFFVVCASFIISRMQTVRFVFSCRLSFINRGVPFRLLSSRLFKLANARDIILLCELQLDWSELSRCTAEDDQRLELYEMFVSERCTGVSLTEANPRTSELCEKKAFNLQRQLNQSCRVCWSSNIFFINPADFSRFFFDGANDSRYKFYLQHDLNVISSTFSRDEFKSLMTRMFISLQQDSLLFVS